MYFKPDFYLSRTFWTAIVTAIGGVGGAILVPEAMATVDSWLIVIMPIVLLLLGVTERKNAASVK